MSAAWWATSSSVARSTARRVSSRPSASVSPTHRTTISVIARKSLVRRLVMLKSLRSEELVPGPAHGTNGLRVAELAAQLRDVDVHRPRAARVRHPPDEVEQPLAGEHDAGMLEEAREQVELLARQVDRGSVDRDVVLVAAQLDRPGDEHLARIAVLGPAQDCLDTRRELARRER